MPVVFDKQWCIPNADEYIRHYLAQSGVNVPHHWEVLGEIAVIAAKAQSEKVRFSALRELASYTRSKPKSMEVSREMDSGTRPLNIGLASDVLLDAEYMEIEEEANAEFSTD